MKMRHFFAALAAVFTLGFTVSCDEDFEPTYFNDLKVSNSYVALPVGGGSKTIDITADGSWNVSGQPSWLTVSPASGTGDGTITFSAEAYEGRDAELLLSCNDKTLRINVIQGIVQVSTATVKEVMTGPDKTYRVTGAVTKITESATYGNFYLNDGTSDTDLYIYGTLYEGKTKQGAIEKLGIDVGDVVTIEGPKTVYNSTVELVDVTVLNIKKSLIKVMQIVNDTVPADGGEVTISCQVKGTKGLFVELTDEQSQWLSVKSIQPGIMQDPNDTKVSLEIVNVNLGVAANSGSTRQTTIKLSSSDDSGNTSQVSASLLQEGSIVDCNIATFLNQPTGPAQFRLTGRIKNIANTKYGNLTIQDATGEVYVYGTTHPDGTKYDVLPTLGIKDGDLITIIGVRSEYGGNAQVGGAVYESHATVTKINAADFNTLADDANTWYELTGVVTDGTNQSGHKFDLTTYGNFDLVDETGNVYVYGLRTGWNGEAKKAVSLGLVAGDKITIVANKASYNKAPQAGNAWFVCKY